jgi:Rad3-related DNA helicase
MSLSAEYFPKSPPFNGNPREGQLEAIDQIHSALESGKKMFVLAAPTGTGKSVILYTLAKMILDRIKDGQVDGATFTTSQKILQDQYQKDFKDMFVLKGRSNYPCKIPADDEDDTCANGKCLYDSQKFPCLEFCPYLTAKKTAILSELVTTNFAYFIGESNGANAFGIRKLLILDEAHNIESVLMGYVECSISRNALRFCEIKDVEVPMYDDFSKYEDWLRDLSKIVKERLEHLEHDIDTGRKTVKECAKIMKRLINLSGRLSFLLFNKEKCQWIADPDREKAKVSFKPINVSIFAKSLVFQFGEYIILSSATISKAYVTRCLGIPEEEFEYLELPSTFPVANRPIKALNVGKMSFNVLHSALPKIVQAVDAILEKFKDQKGIVHATSYRIANYILENTKYPNRFVSHNSVDRMEKLEEHCNSPHPTVLLSPSMTEGIDLKGDLSTFQVIVKIPYPSLGDKQIRSRAEIDGQWYKQQAATTMMQAYGRSVRSKTDTAATYFLDSAFKWFVKSNPQLFCKWFTEAIL